MTDIDVYQQPAGLGQYQAGILMTKDQAKALDDQVRQCTAAVLREGTDYGIIPGTNGEKTLWRPGAQKLLQWFGLGYTCERVEVERDDDGRKHGITYRATVARRLPDGTLDIKATCEGTADYDESKFHQTAEQVKARLRDQEHKWAAKDRRAPNADRWNSAKEYRADWNALMKRAQKRAIVGAVVDATAAGGIFTDREEDDHAPVTDDGLTWYEEALGDVYLCTSLDDARKLHVKAAQGARDGLCTPRQATHIQNVIAQRIKLFKTVTPADVEDLGRQAAQQHAAPERLASGVPDETPASGPAPDAGPPRPSDEGAKQEVPAEDQPGTASPDQLTSLHIILGALGFSSDDRDAKLRLAETITGRELTGPNPGRTSKNLTMTEARKLTDTLDGFAGDRDKLIAYMAGREQDGERDG